MSLRTRAWISVAGAIAALSINAAMAQPFTSLDDPGLATAWRTLRVVDCARCHGKHNDGLAAPSIVDYARTQSREMFLRAVLDGTPGRGMPGYRSNALVAATIDDLYRYFKARAEGSISEYYRPVAE